MDDFWLEEEEGLGWSVIFYLNLNFYMFWFRSKEMVGIYFGIRYEYWTFLENLVVLCLNKKLKWMRIAIKNVEFQIDFDGLDNFFGEMFLGEILKMSLLKYLWAPEASGVGSGYSQGLCGPPQVISRPLDFFAFGALDR